MMRNGYLFGNRRVDIVTRKLIKFFVAFGIFLVIPFLIFYVVTPPLSDTEFLVNKLDIKRTSSGWSLVNENSSGYGKNFIPALQSWSTLFKIPPNIFEKEVCYFSKSYMENAVDQSKTYTLSGSVVSIIFARKRVFDLEQIGYLKEEDKHFLRIENGKKFCIWDIDFENFVTRIGLRFWVLDADLIRGINEVGAFEFPSWDLTFDQVAGPNKKLSLGFDPEKQEVVIGDNQRYPEENTVPYEDGFSVQITLPEDEIVIRARVIIELTEIERTNFIQKSVALLLIYGICIIGFMSVRERYYRFLEMFRK